ncbi:MAG: hypothetical protein KatS3mg070_0725 [Meiothermus sp.]|nr:MAG: hypothetical protein KatS3mg070_0725 [Meiothermus sp.]
MQEVTGEQVEVAFVDQGYTGEEAAQAAEAEGIALCVVKVEGAKRGFVLLPKRWGGGTFVCLDIPVRRLARDYERLAETLRGWHCWLFRF